MALRLNATWFIRNGARLGPDCSVLETAAPGCSIYLVNKTSENETNALGLPRFLLSCSRNTQREIGKMKKWVLRILGAFGVLILALLGFLTTRPAESEYKRSLKIPKSAEVIQPLVSDFKSWGQWSPWDGLDPNMTKEFFGETHAVGSGYHWKGNNDVGEGEMAILSIVPAREVRMRLDFVAPFADSSETTFTFEPQPDGTLVTWSMRGKDDSLLEKFFAMAMAGSIEADFDKGLASLAALAANAAP